MVLQAINSASKSLFSKKLQTSSAMFLISLNFYFQKEFFLYRPDKTSTSLRVFNKELRMVKPPMPLSNIPTLSFTLLLKIFKNSFSDCISNSFTMHFFLIFLHLIFLLKSQFLQGCWHPSIFNYVISTLFNSSIRTSGETLDLFLNFFGK